MDIVFTKHAQIRSKQRKLSFKLISKTIKNPDIKSLEDEKTNKIAYFRKYKPNLAIKVVAKIQDKHIIVITVHPVKIKDLSNVKPLIENL